MIEGKYLKVKHDYVSNILTTFTLLYITSKCSVVYSMHLCDEELSNKYFPLKPVFQKFPPMRYLEMFVLKG